MTPEEGIIWLLKIAHKVISRDKVSASSLYVNSHSLLLLAVSFLKSSGFTVGQGCKKNPGCKIRC